MDDVLTISKSPQWQDFVRMIAITVNDLKDITTRLYEMAPKIPIFYQITQNLLDRVMSDIVRIDETHLRRVLQHLVNTGTRLLEIPDERIVRGGVQQFGESSRGVSQNAMQNLSTQFYIPTTRLMTSRLYQDIVLDASTKNPLRDNNEYRITPSNKPIVTDQYVRSPSGQIMYHPDTLARNVQRWHLDVYQPGEFKLQLAFVAETLRLVSMLQRLFRAPLVPARNLQQLQQLYADFVPLDASGVSNYALDVAEQVRLARQRQMLKVFMPTRNKLPSRRRSASGLMEAGGLRTYNLYRRGLKNYEARGRVASDTSESVPKMIKNRNGLDMHSPEEHMLAATTARYADLVTMQEAATEKAEYDRLQRAIELMEKQKKIDHHHLFPRTSRPHIQSTTSVYRRAHSGAHKKAAPSHVAGAHAQAGSRSKTRVNRK